MEPTKIPFLSEHEGPSQSPTNAPATYSPTDEEKRTIKLGNQILDKNKKFRKQYDQHWLDRYKFFRGKQWKESRPSYRHSEVINMVFSSIQASVPIQLDSKPRWEFLPQTPHDMELASILSEIAESDFVKHNWLMVMAEVIYESYIYGTGLACMDYDPEADFGLGAIDFHCANPFYCFPDTIAKDVNKKSRNFVYAEPIEMDQIKTQYPDKAEWVKPDLQDLMLEGSKQDLDQIRFKSPVDTKVIVEGNSAYETGQIPRVLKVCVYTKSDEYIEQPKEGIDPDTQIKTTLYEQKLKYPNGRKFVIAGGVLCEDGENPFDDGLFPYARYVNYILPHEFWGISDIEQLEGPQKMFNKILSFALDIYTLMGNPVWVVDNNSEVDTDNLFNRPGLVIEKNPGSEVRREPGIDINPTLMSLADRLRNWFNETQGQSDVSRGIEPKDITSGIAISQLQEAAQTRLRQKSRQLDAFLQDCGQLYLSRVFQFYSSPKIVRITENQEAMKFFKFHIQTKIDDQGNSMMNDKGDPVREARLTPMSQGSDGEVIEQPTKTYMINGYFDVKVSTGSALPFAKTARSNLAVTMFKLGAIDRPELLKNVDWPNWESVAQRMDQQDQAKAQAMQQAAATKGR